MIGESMTKVKHDFNETSEILSQEIEDSLKALRKRLNERYPLGVPRKVIGPATGYALHPRTEANNDCSGDPIPGRFKIGRQVIYPVSGIIQRIKSKMTIVS